MNSGQVATGFIRGTGAAVNVTLGWIPEFVQLLNLTDGNEVDMHAVAPVLLFTSGGTSAHLIWIHFRTVAAPSVAQVRIWSQMLAPVLMFTLACIWVKRPTASYLCVVRAQYLRPSFVRALRASPIHLANAVMLAGKPGTRPSS
jgi:hypothetical protein